MAIERNKHVLEGNAFPKGKTEIIVAGMPGPLVLTSFGDLTREVGVIELKDKRQIPGGRTAPGEFEASVQLALDPMRDALLSWSEMAIDRGSGVDPNYKRDAVITYVRHFQGSPASETAGAGNRGTSFKLKAVGLWIQKVVFPGGDMEGGHEGGDADSILQLTFKYDSLTLVGRHGARGIGGFFGAG